MAENLREARKGRVHVRRPASREPGAEVRRLHRAGAAAADHEPSPLGQALRERDDTPIVGIGPQQGVAAHHAHHGGALEAAEEGVHRLADVVVVEGARPHLHRLRIVRARRGDVPRHARVEAVRGVRRVPGVEELVRRVEAWTRHVVGHLGEIPHGLAPRRHVELHRVKHPPPRPAPGS